MVTEYIRYRLKTHSRDELVSAYSKAAPFLQSAPECLSYELQHCQEDQALSTLRILWTSTEAHLTGFRKGPNFPPFLAAIRPFIEEIEEMQHYAATEIGWRRDD